MDEGNAGGKSAHLGRLTDKDTVLLADFTNNTDDEGFNVRLRVKARVAYQYFLFLRKDADADVP